MEALYAEITDRAEAATSSYYVAGKVLQLILCLWQRIIRTSDQGVLFMVFPSQIFFNDINHGYRAALLKKNFLLLFQFYMAMTTYFLLWKGAQSDAYCNFIIPP